MKNKRIVWIIIVLVLIAIVGGGYYYSDLNQRGVTDAEEPEMQTSVANRGDIVIYASGTGQVVPVYEIGLGFDQGGTLIELNTEEGQLVTKDELLARLQTEKTEQEIAASISSAELVVTKAENALEELYSAAEEAKTQALSEIDTYTQEVRDANYTLYNYTIPISIADLNAEEAVSQTGLALDEAIQAFEPYRYFSEYDETREELLEDVNEAQALYNSAVTRQNYEYKLEIAKANLSKAQKNYETYKDGPDKKDLHEAEGELENAQANLKIAQEEKSILELLSKIDGTVLSVDVVVGATINGGDTIITIADLSQPTLEVYVDETDLDSVAVGYQAEIVFDALPDQTFYGEVILVSPGLVEVSNVKAVRAVVRINEESLSPGMTLPSGLNAAVDIIAARSERTVLIPVEALRELGDNMFGVFVVEEDGTPKLRPVEVGLMDVTFVEIISGIEVGETVSTGIVSTK
jgi:HlyD family secretion protein